ncbi:conserved Plasmodium protein, unknown function [Plasmodium sp. DRC-Itaito]|nr:conserved Plasmodium protein, unknown function [Plasmodium sp. DRC-Itaito]
MNNKARSKKEKYLYNQYDQCYDIFLKKNDITNIAIPQKQSEVTNTHIQFEEKNKKKRKEKYPYRIIKIIKGYKNEDIVFYSVNKINKIKKYNFFIIPYEYISEDIYLKKKKNSVPSNNINNNLSFVEELEEEEKNVTYILKKNRNYNFVKYNNFIILARQKRKKYYKIKKIKKKKKIKKFNYFILKKFFIINNKNNISLECKNNTKHDDNIYYYNKKTKIYNGYVDKENDHLKYKECDSYKDIITYENKKRHDHNDYKNIATFKCPLLNILINNIKYISNYEYIIEKKLCYDCYCSIKLNKIKNNVDTNKNDMNDHTYININEYMKKKEKKKKKKKDEDIKNIYPNKLNTNEKKNRKLKNSYIFTYGFYSKKGKYHMNEDCSSHTLFSSFKIFQEIKKFYTNIKKRNYCFFDELMNVFDKTQMENKKKDLLKCDTYYHNDYMKLSKVYVKLCNPFFFLSLKKNKKENNNKTYPYDIIYNYFCDDLDEKKKKKKKKNINYINNNNNNNSDDDKNILYNNTYNIKKGSSKKQIISNQINSSNNTTDILNYKEKKLKNLMHNNENNFYYTYDSNIRRKHKYIFICKNCKKKEYINKKKSFHVNYLKYLFNKKTYLNKKKKEHEKYFINNKYNIYDENLLDLLNDKNNSTTSSDEFQFLKFKKNKNKNKKKYIYIYPNDIHKDKHINNKHFILEEHYFKKQEKSNVISLKNYFIKCRTCRHLSKYDNLVNEDILNIFKRNNILMSPILLSRSNNMLPSLLLSCYKNKKNKKNIKDYIINCLYIQSCRKARKDIKKDITKNKKKEKKKIIENSFDNINICDTLNHSVMSNASYYYSDLEVYTKNQVRKRLEKKLKISLLIKRVNRYHRSKSCNIIRDESNGVDIYDMHKEFYYMNNYNINKDIICMDNKYIPYIISHNKEMFFKHNKKTNNIHNLYDHYDIHLFTICDGHSSCHTSSFIIKNIHKIFYYLLIHTFFNIYMSLKLIHPFLDLLYYKICLQNNLKKSNGSCIINVLINKNYIYVSNTGDSKCSLMTFNLDIYDYECKEKKKEKKKEKNKKKNKGIMSRLNVEGDIINAQGGKICGDKKICGDNNICGGETRNELNYESYKINSKSISYNELNSEHNCNNYFEYLRIYKMYMKHYVNENNHNKNADNRKKTNVGEDHTYNNNNNIYLNKCDENIFKNINRRYHCDIHDGNNICGNLKETIYEINNLILKEKEETQINIGNIPNNIIHYNRLNGCLHPSRVIGDYDIKKRYMIYKNILSNYSNIYKYNMNNINFYNNIHYLYKYKKCNECRKNYILNSYGKFKDINDLILLKKTKNKNKNLNIRNHHIIEEKKYINLDYNKDDNNTIHFVNSYLIDNKKKNNNINDNFYDIKYKNNITNMNTHSNVIKVYKETHYNNNYNMDEQSNDNNKKKKKKKFHLYPDEQLLPYIHFKPTNLNKNYIYKSNKKNFFHLLLIASDGVFEYINPYIILNIIKKHKTIYTKIQKIYYLYNNYIKYINTTNHYLNYMMHNHNFLITSKECFELSRDIVRTTIRMGNYDDSSCFCIFLFPQF